MGRSPDRSESGFPFEGRTQLLVGVGYVAAFLLVAVVLSATTGVGGTPMLFAAIVVPLVPLLAVMAAYGYVSEVAASGGPFSIEVLFAEVANSTIRPVTLEDQVIEIPLAEREVPNMGPDVNFDAVERRPVLWFQLGHWVDPATIDEFVAKMPRLSYVIFTDTMGRLEGLLSATDFRSVYGSDRQGFVEKLESGDVLEVAGVVTETITAEATNADALEKMDAGTDKLGVVDEEGQFVGVITQDAISRGILLELFERAGEP